MEFLCIMHKLQLKNKTKPKQKLAEREAKKKKKERAMARNRKRKTGSRVSEGQKRDEVGPEPGRQGWL